MHLHNIFSASPFHKVLNEEGIFSCCGVQSPALFTYPARPLSVHPGEKVSSLRGSAKSVRSLFRSDDSWDNQDWSCLGNWTVGQSYLRSGEWRMSYRSVRLKTRKQGGQLSTSPNSEATRMRSDFVTNLEASGDVVQNEVRETGGSRPMNTILFGPMQAIWLWYKSNSLVDRPKVIWSLKLDYTASNELESRRQSGAARDEISNDSQIIKPLSSDKAVITYFFNNVFPVLYPPPVIFPTTVKVHLRILTGDAKMISQASQVSMSDPSGNTEGHIIICLKCVDKLLPRRTNS